MEDFLKNLILESFNATLKAKENNFARLCKEELVGFNDEFYNENEILDLEDNTPNETLLKSILNVACMGKYNSWTLEKFHQRLIENGISNFSNSHELYEYLQQKGSSVFTFISPIMFTHTRTDLCKLMHGTLENWDLEQKIIQEAEQRSDAYYEFLNLKISNTNKHMENVSTVNFEDQFDFSPGPLDSPLEDSDEKLNFGQGQQQHQQHQDQFTQLINQQPVPVESVSNRCQGTSSQVSSYHLWYLHHYTYMSSDDIANPNTRLIQMMKMVQKKTYHYPSQK